MCQLIENGKTFMKSASLSQQKQMTKEGYISIIKIYLGEEYSNT